MATAKDFMPREVAAAYDKCRKELAEAQQTFVKLRKKIGHHTPAERKAYQELVKRRAALHSAIAKVDRIFSPVRRVLLLLTGHDIG